MDCGRLEHRKMPRLGFAQKRKAWGGPLRAAPTICLMIVAPFVGVALRGHPIQAAKTSDLCGEAGAVTTIKAFPVFLRKVTEARILKVVRSLRIKAATVSRIISPGL